VLQRDFPNVLPEVRGRAAERGLPPVEPPPGWPVETWSLGPLRAAVFAGDRDWGRLLATALKDMARAAATLPDQITRVLDKTNSGELQVHVPEISSAARLLYAGAHQLIFSILATAAGVLAYQAYDRGRVAAAVILGVLAVVALSALTSSIRRNRGAV